MPALAVLCLNEIIIGNQNDNSFLLTHQLFDYSSGILKGNALQQPSSESNALSGWLLEQREATNTIRQVN